MIKTVKKIVGVAGLVVDAEDRQVLGQLIVWSLGLLTTAIILGMSVGLAVRVIWFVTG